MKMMQEQSSFIRVRSTAASLDKCAPALSNTAIPGGVLPTTCYQGLTPFASKYAVALPVD
ncbi:hypothetical protein [Thiohalomonas denitrificans]|uniref:hypothetical protein n=1 Tax=Thiohalomonas denitrificans TaxID=415747 RepID=UPI0026ECA390|nr:hypothetical protein [Thiohalomonas denitrificans]